ncbi:MAG: pyridoxamine 5'-phosphate oxidase family protein, partial [Methylobacterium sp.]
MDAETREPSTILEAPALRAQFGAVGPLAAGKVLDHLDDYARQHQ